MIYIFCTCKFGHIVACSFVNTRLCLGLSIDSEFIHITLPGLTNIQCHADFKKCIKKLHKSGKEGFSKVCPYDTAIPTMVQGMDIAILLSQFGTPKDEL